MGAHYNLYIGPFLRCSTKTEPYEKTINTCSDLECRLRRKMDAAPRANFCPKCGAPTEKVTFEVEGMMRDEIHSFALVEATDESLQTVNSEYAESGEHLFAPNLSQGDHITPAGWDHPTCGVVLDDVPAAVVTGTTWFMSEFADEIAQAKDIYGMANVKVEWGVLGEYS